MLSVLQYKDQLSAGLGHTPVALFAPLAASLCLHLVLAGVLWLSAERPIEAIWVDMLEVKVLSPATRSDAADKTAMGKPAGQKSADVHGQDSGSPGKKNTLPAQATPQRPAAVSSLPETSARGKKPVQQASPTTARDTIDGQPDQPMAPAAPPVADPSESGHGAVAVGSDASPAVEIDQQLNHPIEHGATEETIERRYVREQLEVIRKRVMDRLIYPPLARRQGWGGKVLVGFTIQPDGKVEALQIVRSSGRTLLDRQAQRAIRGAEPFPPPPAALTIVLPVVFEIETAGR